MVSQLVNHMSQITKIIHQTWQTAAVPDQDYPHVWQESWRKHQPDWEYKLWTDEDNERLVQDHYPAFWPMYRTLQRGVVKADAARALYLHKYGGLYADLDYICLKPMTELLHIFSELQAHAGRPGCTLMPEANLFSGWPRTPSNAMMYSPPGNWMFLRLLEDGLRFAADCPDTEHHATEEVCGSNRINWLIHEYQDAANVASIPARFVCPRGPLHDAHDAAAFAAWSDLDVVSAAFPESYAVTAWRGGWWPSAWHQCGTKQATPGS
jgi:hypothetical protein